MPDRERIIIMCLHCGNKQTVKLNDWTVNAKCQNKKCNKWFDVIINININ